ncbi:MAG: response regulator transcription factor [Thiolinea sp.]
MAKITLPVDISAENLRILLVEDHPLFSDALAMTMSEIFDNPSIQTAYTLSESLNYLEPAPPEFVVLDLNLPDVKGIDGLVRIKSLAPQAKIVVVSSVSDNRVINNVIRAGAYGFVPKGLPREEMIRAFQLIADGNIYTPDDYVTPQDDELNYGDKEILKKLNSLTPQQANILTLICRGKLNKQIAFDLSIAETTVKAHLTAIMRKLGVRNRTQAALLANRINYTTLINND